MKLLADTSALVALAMRDDKNHRAAVEFLRQHHRDRFVVTELIVSEVATRVRARTDAARAAGLARSLLDSKRYEVFFVDVDLVRAGINRIERFADKRLSLTDCVSFELMDRLRVPSAFTFDRDFRNCGFEMLP